jgi:hypothetical protein
MIDPGDLVRGTHMYSLYHAVYYVTKAIGNNEERKRNHSTETQDFNVETLSNKER